MLSTIQDVLLAYTGLSDKRNLAIAAKIEAALEPCIAAERAAAAEAMREACAARLEEMRRAHNTAMIGMWHSMDTALAYGDGAEAIRALPIPDASALAERDAARAEAAMATKRERARIVAALIDQADVTPCSEDRRVVFDCARLVLVDFSYDAADHLGDEDAIRRAAATASARAALAGEGREDGA